MNPGSNVLSKSFEATAISKCASLVLLVANIYLFVCSLNCGKHGFRQRL